jgi:tRNA A-37 threonylcarbamoyl transferase component Bud32
MANYPANGKSQSAKSISLAAGISPYSLPTRRSLSLARGKANFRYLAAKPAPLAIGVAGFLTLESWLRTLIVVLFQQAPAFELTSAIQLYAFQILITLVLIKLIRQQFECEFKLSDSGLVLPSGLDPYSWLQFSKNWESSDIQSILLFEDTTRTVWNHETASDRPAKFLLIRLRPFWQVKVDLEAFANDEREQFILRLYRFSERGKMNDAFVKVAEKIEQESMFLPVPIAESQETKPVEKSNDKAVSFTALWGQELERNLMATSYVPLSLGQTVNGGEYTIAEHLSAGGQSTTYVVTNHAGQKHVLKESVFPDNADQKGKAKVRELFAREARILFKCKHPRIAQVYDYFVENKRDYLVLQHIPGLTVGQLVRRSGAAREAEALGWAAEILDITNYLHSMEPAVIHRDLTPDNLILSESGHIYLIDFGAANDALGTATGTMIGKQSYISPEQFRGKATIASDVYAFGATVFFMLTSKDPVPLSISHPRSLNQRVSPELDQLVAWCTEQEESARPNLTACMQIVNRLRKGQFSQGL